jgi:hypothetical protein
MSPGRGSTPRQTDWLTFSRNVTQTQLSSKRPDYSGKLEEYSHQAVSFRNTEEYKNSACEDFTCDLKILCVQ